MYAQIVGWGKALPTQKVSTREIAAQLDTTAEKIVRLTGIEQRYFAPEGVNTSDLASEAGRRALEQAGLDARELDLIVVCTCTADYPVPATAYLVQDALGAANAGAFDLDATCQGFVYGLIMAAGMIEAGRCQNILVIGADLLSRWIDPHDKATRPLFGDGAGAVVLQTAHQPGMVSFDWGADGSKAKTLFVPGGGARKPPTNGVGPDECFVRMEGSQVFEFAVGILRDATQRALAKAGWSIEDVDLIIPHQANLRILRPKRPFLPPEKVFVNIDQRGNTSAATIPIAISDAVEQGKIRAGTKLCLVGFGGGLGWAACTLNWTN